jgi:hypothetical protein
MTKADLAALKREAMSISAIRTTRPRAATIQPSNELGSLSAQRQDEAKRLVAEILAKAGSKTDSLQAKSFQQNRAARDAIKAFPKPRSETLEQRRLAFQDNIAERRAAFAPFATLPTAVTTSMVYLPEPFFVYVSPTSSSGFLQGTSIAPYDSRARIGSFTDYGASVYCDFWFYWTNDSDFQVVLTSASSQTVLNGFVLASISGSFSGIFGHYEAFKFWSGAEINLYQGSNTAVSVDVPSETFDLRTHVDLGVQRSLTFEYDTLTPSTSGWPVAIPPQSSILIQVAPYITWDFYSGWRWFEGEDEGNSGNFFNFDFANNDDPDYFMQCSGVALQIQRPVISAPIA